MDKKVRLEYKLPKGDVSKYRTEIETITEVKGLKEAQNTNSVLEMETTQKILKSGDILEIEVTVDSAVMKQEGKEYTIPDKQEKYIMKMKKDGSILEVKGEEGSGGASHSPFPDREISHGDTWNFENIIPVPGSKPVKMVNYNTLEGFEKVKGYDCVKIRVLNPETTVTIDKGIEQTVTVKGNTFFDYLEGRLIKTEGETRTVMKLPEKQSIITFTKMTMELEGGRSSTRVVEQNPLRLDLALEDF